jgi:NAD(P)-dependent dehydrogenase (short-subunit alcohol dehydrogenase family)
MTHTNPSRRPRRWLARLWLACALLLAGCAEAAPAPASDEPRAAARLDAGSQAPVALVTGSTDGLGREVALALASEGYHVIVHGRDATRGAEVVAAIEAEGEGSARFLAADFASLENVQALADTVRQLVPALRLLVNNAGVGPGAPGHERVITPDGHELRFQVNYLAGFHLTRELLPLLRAGAPSRIVNVSSRGQAPLDFDDLRLDRGYSGGEAYRRSKLAQILFTVDLAEELAGSGVEAFAVHPAPAMDTELVREAGGTPQSTVAQGLRSVMNAIRSTEQESGTFFFELDPRPAHDQAYDAEARRTLRERSEAFVAEALGRGVGAAAPGSPSGG